MIDIELPPLPSPFGIVDPMGSGEKIYTLKDMGDYARAYALAAIEAYRQRRGEVVVTKDDTGAIVAVTRQDEEGRILSVIAEADRKRRGEPVACFKCGHAKHGGECVNVAPQPAERDTTLPYEQALYELIDKIIPGLDSGDPLADAQTASAVLTGKPVGEAGSMPGSSAFTMASFKADEVPVGTKLYAAPQPAEPVKHREVK